MVLCRPTSAAAKVGGGAGVCVGGGEWGEGRWEMEGRGEGGLGIEGPRGSPH